MRSMAPTLTRSRSRSRAGRMSVAPLYPSSTNCRSDGTGVPSLQARSLSAAIWLSMVCAAACCSPETRA